MKRLLKRPDYTGEDQTVDMMGFRSSPGAAVDFARNGGILHIEKNGKKVASLMPPSPTVIHPDGTFEGERPLTMGVDL